MTASKHYLYSTRLRTLKILNLGRHTHTPKKCPTQWLPTANFWNSAQRCFKDKSQAARCLGPVKLSLTFGRHFQPKRQFTKSERVVVSIWPPSWTMTRVIEEGHVSQESRSLWFMSIQCLCWTGPIPKRQMTWKFRFFHCCWISGTYGILSTS